MHQRERVPDTKECQQDADGQSSSNNIMKTCWLQFIVKGASVDMDCYQVTDKYTRPMAVEQSRQVGCAAATASSITR